MSAWTHPCCEKCWIDTHPGREPHRFVAAYRFPEICCWCGGKTQSGIYVRENPAVLRCEGLHD